MNITDLLLTRFGQQKPREIGKFNVSDIWAITHKYTSIKEYLNGKTNDFQNCLNMWQGVSKHRQIQELFWGTKYEIEKRIEYQPPEYEWKIVGKADLINEDKVIEIKTSTNLMEKAKPWAEYQTKIYCSLFKKEIGIITQPVIKDGQLILKEIGEVKRDDLWFAEELVKLNDFHLKLKKAKTKAEAPARHAEEIEVEAVQGEERIKEANRDLEEATTTIPEEEASYPKQDELGNNL